MFCKIFRDHACRVKVNYVSVDWVNMEKAPVYLKIDIANRILFRNTVIQNTILKFAIDFAKDSLERCLFFQKICRR